MSAPNQRLAAEPAALRPTRAIHVVMRELGRIGLRTESHFR
jgi:hypothetical protein